MSQHVVVMGVSGSGKSTVAAELARRLGWALGEADEMHPRANIDAMAGGTPLTDADRLPWLRELGRWMAAHRTTGESTVLTCSALRRSYRDVLREAVPDLFLVHLDGEPEVIQSRLAARTGHFMPPELLGSQLAVLEPLEPDEGGVVLDLRATTDELVAQAVEAVEAVQEDPADGASRDETA